MNHISELFYKLFSGKISSTELEELKEWTAQNDGRKKITDLLTDADELGREYRFRKMIDSVRAEEDMKRMIAKAEAPRRRKIILTTMTAAALIAGAFYLGMNPEKATVPDIGSELAIEKPAESETIKPGTTKALIHDSRGNAIALNASDTINRQSFFIRKNDVKTDVKAESLCLEVPRGSEFKIYLEDSTEVWLNSESTLRYPEMFGPEERRVEVTGEAYFSVRKDSRPFYVISGKQQIRVYGTTFNVKDYSDDDMAYTTLESGSIALSRSDSQSGEVFLSPGHQAVFDKEDSRLTMKVVKADVILGWRHGRFVFEGQKLSSIMRDLSRWYDFSYSFEDNDVAETIFHGSIPRYADFKTAIAIIENTGGIRFNISGTNVTITRDYTDE